MFSTRDTSQDVAIIGMAGRFPGANSIDDFWNNLCAGKESVSHFSDEELISNGIPATLLTDPNYVKSNGILTDIELFDANFFGISHRDAEILDPQQRAFLQAAWTALENAGYTPHGFAKPIGVYAAISWNSYFLHNLYTNQACLQAIDPNLIQILSDKDYLASRVSYKLNLTGPSLTIQTACSSSLVAVHLACQSLLCGECDMAMAGGVSIKVPQMAGYIYQSDSIRSPDGKCRAFDASATGCVAGNGLGIVVLKRLEDAIADRDNIYSVIIGSAINNDGALKAGYTAPQINGQARVISSALAVAQIESDTISYIETHGTGTALGDPIEFTALLKAFSLFNKKNKKQHCAIGSVKTNVGHLDVAAGVTGLIKAALSIKNKKIPPSLNYTNPNPKIDFENSPFYVNNKLKIWDMETSPLRAGVSSFGIGGTNAHIILEEFLGAKETNATGQWNLLLISAKIPAVLKNYRENLKSYLQKNGNVSTTNIAYTLAVGRNNFLERQIMLVKNHQKMISILTDSELSQSHTATENCPIIWMFNTQEIQTGVGKFLYESETFFRDAVDQCALIVAPILNIDIRNILYPPNAELKKRADETIKETIIARVSSFTIQYALAKLLSSLGIRPVGVIGCGFGKYIAACFAGILTLKDALSLMQEQLNQTIQLNNSATESEAGLSFTDAISKVNIEAPKIYYYSETTGLLIDYQELKSFDYWSNELFEPTGILNTVTTVREHYQHAVFLEIGSSGSLATLIKSNVGNTPSQRIYHLSLDFSVEAEERLSLLLCLGKLWLHGVSIAWEVFYQLKACCRIPLPTYPFEEKRYWIGAIPNLNKEITAVTSDKIKPIHSPNTNTVDMSLSDPEKLIMIIWQGLFKIEKISIDDAFVELGGDSLLSIQLGARLNETFHINISLNELLKADTIKKQAILVELKIIEQLRACT